MKIWNRIVVGVVIALVIFVCSTGAVVAAELDSPGIVPKLSPPAVPNSFLEKLERNWDRLQNDEQLQELVEKDLERSITIRSQIQEEVDRAFNHTTTLLNVLLAVLTCLPVLAAIGIWFIRRSVLNQILAETKRQLREEVEKQLEADVAAELKQQTEAFQKKIESLETEFQAQLSQFKTLFSDTQQEKDRIIQELATITPSPIRETMPPETQQRIQALTQQLERLQSANSQLSFTANDYVEQGKAFYFENRYEDAVICYDRALLMEIENPKAWFSRGAALVKLQQFDEALMSYDKAIQLKPDFFEAWFGRATVLTKQQQLEEAIVAYEKATLIKPDLFLAWFGKARCYALQGNADQTIENLQQAIHLNCDRAKEAAKADSAFEVVRNSDRFKELVDS